MSDLAEVTAPLAAVLNGVAAGIMLSTVVGIVPMMLTQPYGGYVRTVQFLWPRYDPMMPILNGTAFVLSVFSAVVTDSGAARAVLIGSSALLAVVLAISISKNVPVNRFVSSLDPERPPADWAQVDPRVRWSRWNEIRTSLNALAFTANVAATALLS
jgi:uncharacterized membrane protein